MDLRLYPQSRAAPTTDGQIGCRLNRQKQMVNKTECKMTMLLQLQTASAWTANQSQPKRSAVQCSQPTIAAWFFLDSATQTCQVILKAENPPARTFSEVEKSVNLDQRLWASCSAVIADPRPEALKL